MNTSHIWLTQLLEMLRVVTIRGRKIMLLWDKGVWISECLILLNLIFVCLLSLGNWYFKNIYFICILFLLSWYKEIILLTEIFVRAGASNYIWWTVLSTVSPHVLDVLLAIAECVAENLPLTCTVTPDVTLRTVPLSSPCSMPGYILSAAPFPFPGIDFFSCRMLLENLLSETLRTTFSYLECLVGWPGWLSYTAMLLFIY